MLLLPDWMALTEECVAYIVLSGMIIYLAQIRTHALLIALVLLMPIMVLVSMTDLLVFNLLYAALFAAFRYKAWGQNPTARKHEIFAYFLVLLINIVVMQLWSGLEIAIFRPAFNSPQGTFAIKAWAEMLFYLGGYLLQIVLAIYVQHLLSRPLLTQREMDIILPQLVFVVITMIFVIEFLQVTKQQGIYEVLVIGFLLTQVGYSAQRTIATLRKDQQQVEIEATKQQLAAMRTYTEQLEHSYEQTRKFRHDFKNLLLAMGGSDNAHHEQSLAALGKYSDQVLGQSVLRFGDLSHVHTTALKTLIVTKLTAAEQNGIKIEFECMNDVDTLACDEITVIRIMGILLDNAIEASAKAADKHLRLLVINSISDLEFIVENTFAGTLPKLAQMKRLGFSTKGTGRGYGLANVEELVAKHKQLSLTNYVAEQMFGTSLVIAKEA